MRFQVPQFIEIEDKVFGPFSFKQFVFLGGGAGVGFVLWRILPTFLAVIVVIPIALLSLALAFYRVNNRPFIQLVESAFKFAVGSRLFIWKRTDTPMQTEQSATAERHLHLDVPKLGESKLKDMTWQLDARKGGGEEVR